jgi:L-ascorbate metabolism protein UlaG (beta-lactamase superfamily)
MKATLPVLLLALAAASFAALPPEEFKTPAGVLKITPIQHGSLAIEAGGQVIEVDPAVSGFGAVAPDFSKVPKADIVLITDIHEDHLDKANLAKVRKAGSTVIIPGAASGDVPDGVVMKNGETKKMGPWTIEAIPMILPYTMPPEEAAEAVKAFHPKVVYPYHYGQSDLKVFENALKGTGIDVRIRNWY